MGKGEHMSIVLECSQRLGNRGNELFFYWRSIGACTRCGSTKFWRSPGGVLCSVCHPPADKPVKSWGFKTRRPVILDE